MDAGIKILGHVVCLQSRVLDAAMIVPMPLLLELKHRRAGLTKGASLSLVYYYCHTLNATTMADMYEREVGEYKWCSLAQYAFLKTLYIFAFKKDVLGRPIDMVLAKFLESGPLRYETVDSMNQLLATYFAERDEERARSLYPPPSITQTVATQTD